MLYPASQEGRHILAGQVGQDGLADLKAIGSPDAPTELKEPPALDALRQNWVQQLYRDDGGLRWQTQEDGRPATQLITSPHDVAARFGKKRATTWIGDKVHRTGTCDDDLPHLIVNAATTLMDFPDGRAMTEIHETLSGLGLLPARPVVDAGNIDADLLMTIRRKHEVELVEPMQPPYRSQAKVERTCTTDGFAIDWDRRQATCPQGRPSDSWTPTDAGRQ